MKKITLTLLFSLLLIGCGNKVDEEVLAEISEALKKRWEYTETLDEEVSLDELRTATKTELDNLNEYNLDDFKDKNLFLLYDNYLRELNNALYIIDQGKIDFDNFGDKWDIHLENRAKILYDIDSQYSLQFPEDDRIIFEEVISRATHLVDAESVESKLLEIVGIEDVKIKIEDNSIAITFPTESVLSIDSFVAQKVGFPEKAMEILEIIKNHDYDNIVVGTTNQESIAISSFFTQKTLNDLDFNRWKELDSFDAYKFYSYADAYHIRLGIWNELNDDIKELINDANKDSANPFWKKYGYTH